MWNANLLQFTESSTELSILEAFHNTLKTTDSTEFLKWVLINNYNLKPMQFRTSVLNEHLKQFQHARNKRTTTHW